MTPGEHIHELLYRASPEISPEETSARQAVEALYATLTGESSKHPNDRYILPQYDDLEAIVEWLEEHQGEVRTKLAEQIETEHVPRDESPYTKDEVENIDFLKLHSEYKLNRTDLYSLKTPEEINDATTHIICSLLLRDINLDQFPALTLDLHKMIAYHINITLVLLEFSQKLPATNFSQPSSDIPASFYLESN